MNHDLSAKQLQSFRESNAKINIWEGAVRSGKTYISLWRFLAELADGKMGEYALITRTYDAFRRNILPLLEKMIGVREVNWKGGHRTMRIYEKTIHVIGADDERAEAKIRGPTFAGAYVDEVTILPESVFKMLISRCAMGSSKIFATTNPDNPYHWLKREFLSEKSEDVASWKFTLEDNPELSDKDKEYLKRRYQGLWYQRFIEGLWVQAEGAIYSSFDPKYDVIEHAPSYSCKYIVGVDYGTTNPCAFVLIGMDKSKMPRYWLEDEYYFDSKIHQFQKTDSEYCDDFVQFIGNYPIEAIYLDPSAVSFRTELQKNGVRNVYEAENEVIDGIRFVAKMMRNGTFKLTRKCKHCIAEMQSYVWDEKSAQKGIERPKKQNDHALDAIRYALFTHLFLAETTRLSPQEIDQNYREAFEINQLPSPFSNPFS